MTSPANDRLSADDKPYVTVVSGLPRSGTSLMMQMLAAGGIPPLTDGKRTADHDNPRGYLELERVKQIDSDPSFLADAAGKAVKLIHVLALKLPPAEVPYRVVFMNRPIEEVVASQAAMLERSGREGARLPEKQLRDVLHRQRLRAIKTLGERADVRLLEVDYRSLVNDAVEEAERINAHFDGRLDVKAMVTAVDPSLYRNRG
ncbi:MAG: sulfotransferase family protein [Planctomycetota bacterium]